MRWHRSLPSDTCLGARTPPVAAAGVGRRGVLASPQAPFLNDTLLRGACDQARSLGLSQGSVSFPQASPGKAEGEVCVYGIRGCQGGRALKPLVLIKG